MSSVNSSSSAVTLGVPEELVLLELSVSGDSHGLRRGGERFDFFFFFFFLGGLDEDFFTLGFGDLERFRLSVFDFRLSFFFRLLSRLSVLSSRLALPTP
jgi:hypothetical protein